MALKVDMLDLLDDEAVVGDSSKEEIDEELENEHTSIF